MTRRKVWDQFAGWVQQEVAAAASANFIWATQRARWLAHQVAEHFAGDKDQLLPALRNDPSDALRSVRPMAAPGRRPDQPGQQGADRAARWLRRAADVRDGRHVPRLRLADQPARHRRRVDDGRQERRRRAQADLTKRQNEAKAAVRRYVDDVTFQVAKDSRDRLRLVQRDLRDHFTAQAEQLKRSLQESQQAAERAVKASRGEREARLAEIATALEQLETVRRQARALLPTPGAAGSPARPREAVRAG